MLNHLRITAAFLILLIIGGSPAVCDDARLPEPAYSAALELWRAGKPAEALSKLADQLASNPAGEIPTAARVLKAVLLAEAGRHAESDAEWLAVAQSEPSLKGYALRAEVAGRISRGDVDGAAEMLTTLLAEEGVRSNLDLLLAVADAHFNARNFDKAIAHYDRVLHDRSRGSQADSARLGLAACHDARGDANATFEALRSAQLNHSNASTVVTALEREAELAALLEVKPTLLRESQYRELVDSLRAASLFDDALALLDSWRADYPGSTASDRIELETIETLYRKRDNPAGIERCAAFYKNHTKSPLRDEVRFLELRFYVRIGETDQVKALAKELRSSWVPRSMRHNAGIVLASYLISVGEVSAGLDVYREVYRATTSASTKQDILWRAGVAALRDGQDSRAATNLRSLTRLNPGGDMAPAAWYWLAIAEERLGRSQDALQAALRIDERYPYHYYGFRARLLLPRLQRGFSAEKVEALRKSVRPGRLAFPKTELSGTTKRHELFRAATILAQAGLAGAAAERARSLAARIPSDKGLALLAVRASADAGEYRRSLDLIATHFRSYLLRPADGVPADFWNLAYPRPYWNEIVEAARSQGVDPILMLALMRRESRYDPSAISAVGAVGLFQIMPYTAAELGQGELDTPGLMEPGVNALLGAKVLSRTIQEFDGYFVPAIAAYNAGEDRVGAWWKAGRTLSDDLFIDTMPYGETRRFVREVLTNYFTYNRLYAIPAAADEGQ